MCPTAHDCMARRLGDVRMRGGQREASPDPLTVADIAYTITPHGLKVSCVCMHTEMNMLPYSRARRDHNHANHAIWISMSMLRACTKSCMTSI